MRIYGRRIDCIHIQFVDNMVLFAENRGGLREVSGYLSRTCKIYNMKINIQYGYWENWKEAKKLLIVIFIPF